MPKLFFSETDASSGNPPQAQQQAAKPQQLLQSVQRVIVKVNKFS